MKKLKSILFLFIAILVIAVGTSCDGGGEDNPSDTHTTHNYTT